MNNDQRMDICRAAFHAQKIADAMNIAYWTTENRSVFEIQTNNAHDAFKELAEIMGYKVERME